MTPEIKTYTLEIPHRPFGVVHGIPTVTKTVIVPSARSKPSPPMPSKGLKRYLNYYADYGGCGHWRMIWPEYLLNIYQKSVVSGFTTMIQDKHFYNPIETVKVQRQATPVQGQFLNFIKGMGKRVIYDIDDIVFSEDIPDYNGCKSAFVGDEIRESILKIMGSVNEISVTCQAMKDYYIDKTGNNNVTIIPNYIPKFWADGYYDRKEIIQRYHRNKKRPRIGYTGSSTHFDLINNANQKDDFYHVVDYIIRTRKKYQWVFMGGVPWKLRPFVQNGEIELVEWSNLNDFPRMVHSMNVNCFIAPLADNTFNRCKSNIKYLESATQGIPIVCQDIVTYKECPLRFTTGSDMIDKLDSILNNQKEYLKMSDTMRKYAETMWLEDHLDEHIELYSIPYGSPRPKLDLINA